MDRRPDYTEFSNPRLVAFYDHLNPLDVASEFFCDQAKRLGARTIIDLGCGTGLLTCELSRRGHNMIGLEPSPAMLAAARAKPGAEHVSWIDGGYERLAGLQADMLLMTSHVAQFFLEDAEWDAMLKAARAALEPGGHIMFDSRNPLAKPWETWRRDAVEQQVATEGTDVRMWPQLQEVKGRRVVYELHYLFGKSQDELISVNELVFRSRDDLGRSLADSGFAVKEIYGDWDGSALGDHSPEMIFVAGAS
jgi:SAM-dependent methyltransferase